MDVAAGLKKLGLDEQSARVLGLLPLVHIAWADGTVQRSERKLIVDEAERLGWLHGKGREVLDGWLAEPPSDEVVETGIELLNALGVSRDALGRDVTSDTLHLITLLAADVARAAGGYFGLKEPVVAEEEQRLRRIAELLDIDSATSWWERFR